MKLCYSPHYNFDLGLLGALHPFDGTKFRKVHAYLKNQSNLDIVAPESPMAGAVIEEFISPAIKQTLANKQALLAALEFPNLPFISYDYIRRKVIEPMRWGVAGTFTAAETALKSGFCWNLSGGYHHASPHSIEGFCLFNDIGICYQQLINSGQLTAHDKVLIIDVDAHHGNGNALSFLNNSQITLLDVYNQALYPTTHDTRSRVDIAVPLDPYCNGHTYLEHYEAALRQLSSDYALAFIIAGTDVLSSDRLGQLSLTIEDVTEREKLTLRLLTGQKIPTVVVSGGGYSRESAQCMAETIMACRRYCATH